MPRLMTAPQLSPAPVMCQWERRRGPVAIGWNGRLESVERMAEVTGLEDWQQAWLIPVAGIRGQEEQEARATSAFLAVHKDGSP
jgi:hypothetical protein